MQLSRVTGALSLRGLGLTESLVAAVAQVVLVGQLAATTVAATADSQSFSSREGSREVVTTQQQQQGELQTGWRAQRRGIWRQEVTTQQQIVSRARARATATAAADYPAATTTGKSR